MLSCVCSVCVCVCCVCAYTDVQGMMRRCRRFVGMTRDQPLSPGGGGPVKGPERKAGVSPGAPWRLTVCGAWWQARGGGVVGTGLFRLRGTGKGESLLG